MSTLRDAAQAVVDNWDKGDLAAAALRKLAEKLAEPLATENEINTARDIYLTDDIEIDDMQVAVSVGEGGKWIAAWGWLSDEDLEEDEQEDILKPGTVIEIE